MRIVYYTVVHLAGLLITFALPLSLHSSLCREHLFLCASNIRDVWVQTNAVFCFYEPLVG